LEAARCQFTETSFDGTGLRAIADRAGVNVALISRYFGSKEGLFLAAVPPRIDMRYLLAGPMQDFGERAAGIMEMKVVGGCVDPGGCQPGVRTGNSRRLGQSGDCAVSDAVGRSGR
jgi:hypothetical protein